jgi:hypothetical protein
VLTPAWRTATVYEYAINEGHPVDTYLQPGVFDITVRPDGVIAWIAETDEVAGYDGMRPLPRRQVLMVRPTRSAARLKPTLLASGGDIEVGSLAVGRRAIYWSEAGQARVAPAG